MKKIAELTKEQIRDLVANVETLREQFGERIRESEMFWIEEKLDCIKSGCSDWSIGFYNQNFLSVGDSHEFVDGVLASIRAFGSSDKLERLVQHCDRLMHTNLFDHYVEKLADCYLEEEIKPICDYVEDIEYKLYLHEVTPEMDDYLEMFAEDIADYIFDEDNKILYTPSRVA